MTTRPVAEMAIERRVSSHFASFRDPAGRVVRTDDRVIRYVKHESSSQILSFLQSRQALDLIRDGSLIGGEQIDPAHVPNEVLATVGKFSANDLFIEHEPIFFPTYPYEWPAEMLAAAGRLTLDISLRLLPLNLRLKDASPYNVLFQGAKPTFVDWGSFEYRKPGDGTWLAYAQFVSTFIIPLLLEAHTAAPAAELLYQNRDGIDPAIAIKRMPFFDRLRPKCLQFITLPAIFSTTKASQRPSLYSERLHSTDAKARFVLQNLIRNLDTFLRAEQHRKRRSHWAEYTTTQRHYDDEQQAFKLAFVSSALRQCQPCTVLDVGCNTGAYSFEAASDPNCRVISIDSDRIAVGQLWRSAAGRPNVIPLVVDITRPTPAVGWRNQECQSFLRRVTGVCQMVMMLAVIHHMIISERIPFQHILDLLFELTTKWAIVEMIEPADPLFQMLARGRSHLYDDLGRAPIERLMQERFEIVRVGEIPRSLRRLYFLRKRS